MGILSDLPPELIALIVDNLHDDRAALRACALVSRVFLPLSQAHLFECVQLWGRWICDDGIPESDANLAERDRLWFFWILCSMDEPAARGNIDTIRRFILPGPHDVLSYTQSLSIFIRPLVQPQHLETIYDYLMAFKNVKELQISLFAPHFTREDLTLPSRYFSHFQPTLRCLHLKTLLENPKDLVKFIAFFPLLEEVSIETIFFRLPSLPDGESDWFDPDLLSPFRGSLKLSQFRHENAFATELAKVRVQYHTLSLCDVTVWTGIRELIIACAPTLRALNILRETYGPEICWDPLMDIFPACTGLTEIDLPLPICDLQSNLQRCSTLILTVPSPHLQKITITFDDDVVTDVGVATRMLSYEEWRTFEDALLRVSSRSRNVLKSVIIFLEVPHAQAIPGWDTFLPRFREVGEVILEFPTG